MPNKFKKRRKIYKMEIDENDDSGVFAISLVSEPAIEETFLYLSKNFQMVQLAEVDSEKRILVGPVLIPNKEIPRVDEETGEEYSIVFPPEVVEKAAQMFLKNQKNNNATLEHMKDIDDLSVVESWIIADPEKDKSAIYGMKYPKGTWMVVMKINNDEIWKDYVKTGKVKGFSLEGLFGHNLIENGGYGYGWGIPDVQSSDSPQTYPSSYPHGIANRPNNTPYNTQQLSREALNESNDNAFAKEILDEVKNLLLGKKVNLQSYSDYPEAVKNNAKRGIQLNDKVGNRCATQVGKVRAQQLAKGEPISTETIKRMYSYLSRAGEFFDESDTSACGTVSYLLWGGLAGLRWSKSKLKELGEIEELETSVSIASTYAGQFGTGKAKVHKGVKTYIAESLQAIPGNIDVFGYPTKNFEICPGASALFNHFKDMDESLGINDEDKGMIRSAAQIADNIFAIEKKVIENEIAGDDDIMAVNILVDDFIDLVEEIDEQTGMGHNTDFMYNHIDIIQSYYNPVADIQLEEGLEGACWEGYEAIGFKMLDGKRVPNCVPIKE